MKFTIVSAVLIAILLDVCSTQSNNNKWGQRSPGDRLLQKATVKENYKFLQIVNRNLLFQSPHKITFINVTDQYTNGNGGHASLLSGGIGQNKAIIQLQSQRNYGLNFIIDIYGKP
ncbi:uncharacterized protein CBL_07049 [Carabus blaptoides fortunei]